MNCPKIGINCRWRPRNLGWSVIFVRGNRAFEEIGRSYHEHKQKNFDSYGFEKILCHKGKYLSCFAGNQYGG